jgi:lipopolysaccharide assembly protein A
MKALRTGFWAIVGVCLIIVGLANRGPVTVRAMPEALGNLLGLSPDFELPLFVVIFLGVAAGLLIGFFWEWLRAHKFRADARSKGREVVQLRREMDRLRDSDGDGKDDVLALLDASAARR